MSLPVAIDEVARTDRRASSDRRGKAERRQKPQRVEVEQRVVRERRQKVERRRQIDPTTCERDYTDAEVEFMTAMDRYRRQSGRPFPTWSEVLEVLLALGYRKTSSPAEPPAVPTGV